jgi:hypothetical protein
MPGFLFHVAAQASCTHGGQLATVSSNTRVLVNGMQVATLPDLFTIAACPFTLPNGTPMPCLTAQWLTPATRILINGSPPILQTSAGLTLNAAQAPQGTVTAIVTQTRVMGT